MEPTDGARGKGREGVMVAALGANDEVSLHRAPAVAAAWLPRSAIMSPRAAQSFHLANSTATEARPPDGFGGWPTVAGQRVARAPVAQWIERRPPEPDRLRAVATRVGPERNGWRLTLYESCSALPISARAS
jgi:hypothetical protein